MCEFYFQCVSSFIRFYITLQDRRKLVLRGEKTAMMAEWRQVIKLPLTHDQDEIAAITAKLQVMAAAEV